MGGAAACGKVILVLLNMLFLLISLALLAVGVIVKFFGAEFLGKFLGTVSTAATNSGFPIPALEKVKDLPFLDQIGLALIIFGSLLLVISFCACCGACCGWRPLLVVFVVVMMILVIAQAVVGGLFLATDSTLHNTIKKTIVDKIQSDYKHDDDKDAFSIAINLMNYLLQCCGMSGYADFEVANVSPTCCLKEIIEDSSNSIYTASASLCKNGKALPIDVNQKGCYTYLQDLIRSNLTIGAVVLAILLLLQVIEIIFAIVIIKDVGSKVSPF